MSDDDTATLPACIRACGPSCRVRCSHPFPRRTSRTPPPLATSAAIAGTRRHRPYPPFQRSFPTAQYRMAPATRVTLSAGYCLQRVRAFPEVNQSSHLQEAHCSFTNLHNLDNNSGRFSPRNSVDSRPASPALLSPRPQEVYLQRSSPYSCDQGFR